MQVNRILGVSAGVAMLAVAAAPMPALSSVRAAGGSSTLASWQMNEAAGAKVMVDASGHVNGQIGSAVQTGVTVMGATAYRWPFTSPTKPPAQPQRIIQAQSSTLNPGSGTYIVTLRYRTTEPFGNIIQKGQGGAKGGYFKIEGPGGHLNCVFRGTSSTGAFLRKDVESPKTLDDGAWHLAVCTRTATALTLSIDGVVVATAHGSSGTIANPNPVTIGGKLNCDQVKVTCDYFSGWIDYITIQN